MTYILPLKFIQEVIKYSRVDYFYSMKLPPFLLPGNTIGIACPAGYMPTERAEFCVKTLKKWGYKVVKGKTLGGKSKNYFSGTDQERLEDLQRMLDDDKIHAVLFGRGGYGTSRILDQLNWKKFKKHPKWIIGFSDITVLHGYMHQQLQIASIHGPMAGAFNHDEGNNRYINSLKDSLEGKPTIYLSKAQDSNRLGKAKAALVGGNLSLLVHSIGTNAELNTDGKILFIEEIGEQLYHIDRMLLQLARAGKLKKIKGLIIGGFSECKDTLRPFGKNLNQIILDAVQAYRFPVCFDFPISHEIENVAVIIGKEYTLEVGADQVTLSSI